MDIWKKIQWIFQPRRITQARLNGQTQSQLFKLQSPKHKIKLKYVIPACSNIVQIGDKVGIIKFNQVKRIIYNFGVGTFLDEKVNTKNINKDLKYTAIMKEMWRAYKHVKDQLPGTIIMNPIDKIKIRPLTNKVYKIGSYEITDEQLKGNGFVGHISIVESLIQEYKTKNWKIREVKPSRIDYY